MTDLVQKIIIAYAFFIFGMMGGFIYLNSYEYVLNHLFNGSPYLPWFLSAMLVLLFMGFTKIKQQRPVS